MTMPAKTARNNITATTRNGIVRVQLYTTIIAYVDTVRQDAIFNCGGFHTVTTTIALNDAYNAYIAGPARPFGRVRGIIHLHGVALGPVFCTFNGSECHATDIDALRAWQDAYGANYIMRSAVDDTVMRPATRQEYDASAYAHEVFKDRGIIKADADTYGYVLRLIPRHNGAPYGHDIRTP